MSAGVFSKGYGKKGAEKFRPILNNFGGGGGGNLIKAMK